MEVIVAQVRSIKAGLKRLEEELKEQGSKLEGHDSLTSIKGIGAKSATILLSYMTGLPQLADNWQFWDLTLFATTNPDVVFVEFKGCAEVTATGRKYEQTYIGRLEMRGEKMSKYREFWNPQAIVDAFMP